MEISSASSQSASRNGKSVWHAIHSVNYVEEKVYLLSAQLNSLVFLTAHVSEALTKVLISGYGKKRIDEFTATMDNIVEAVIKGSCLRELTQDLTKAWNNSSPIEELVQALEMTNNAEYIRKSEVLRKMYLDASEFKDFLDRAQKGLDYQEYTVGLLMVAIYKEIAEERKNLELDED